MIPNLKIKRVARSRLPEFDIEGQFFGDSFSDHMFTMLYDGERWTEPSVVPYGPITIDPSAISIQYAQSVFEGMKAYRGVDGVIRLFRPERNAQRLRTSCARLCMPGIDDETFISALSALVRVDADWVPHKYGHSLYIRPVVMAADGYIAVRPARRYRFIVITSPVGMYFREGGAGVRLKVEERYVRAPAEGGLGAAKAGANYAASLLAGENCVREGFDQVLWLDSSQHRYIEEAGLMNVFFIIDGRAVTPQLGDSILPGVTRDSIIVLLKDRGIKVDERAIAIDEVATASKEGRLTEMFACGTAAVVSPIGELNYRGQSLRPAGPPASGALTRALYDELTGIHFGRLPDRHGWTRPVETETALTRVVS